MASLAEKIEEELRDPHVTTQNALRSFMQRTRAMIDTYEQSVYEEGRADAGVTAQVRQWRTALLAVVRENKDLPDGEDAAQNIETTEEKEGIEVLKMVNRQLLYASNNQKLLERGTLKLVGLDYSYDEIEREVEETRKKVSLGRSKERAEKRNLVVAFIIFILVCMFILADKVRARLA